MSDLRSLPSVDQLLQTRQAAEMIAMYGRPLAVQAIRGALDDLRIEYKSGQGVSQKPDVMDRAQKWLARILMPTLVPVINATGVVLHTNLGRSPLSRAAIQAVQDVAGRYSALEYNLESGERGSRSVHIDELLEQLIGCEASLVVNNNAAAVLLVLTALARRRQVVIARTQLVEIGGGFRVPAVMSQSGAHLVEVGTTNRVHISDYEEALLQPAALILRAHRSNFKIIGFTSEPGLAELAALARQHGIPLVDDLGSGALLNTARFGLAHEPTVQESLAAGADLVCFSGDKLLGGPQAGIIVGRGDLIARIKKHPLARAVRADKLCLAALSATLLHYLKDEAEREIPIWQMLSATTVEIEARAQRWIQILGVGEVITGLSTIGGGSLPGEELATRLVAFPVSRPNHFLAQLRQQKPAVVARIQDERVVLDPRTVLPDQEEALLAGLKSVLSFHPFRIKKSSIEGN